MRENILFSNLNLAATKTILVCDILKVNRKGTLIECDIFIRK